MAGIEIAQIAEANIDSFHAALDVVCRERAFLSFIEAPPLEETRAFVRKTIASRHVQLVALDGGTVVGWCDVLPAARSTMRHGGVLGIGLLPAWRGRGLGERLLRLALDAARDRALTRIELSVRQDNTRAIALYRKLGFTLEGQKRNALLIDGVYYDLVLMALLLDVGQTAPDPIGDKA